MDKQVTQNIIIMFCLIAIVMGVGIGTGAMIGQRVTQRQAIENGVAEYVLVDKTTGETKFEWKTPK